VPADGALALSALACALGFAAVARAVGREWCRALDERLLEMMPPPAPATRLDSAMRDFSALGGDTIRLLFLIAGSAGLAAAGAWRAAALFFVLSLASRLLVVLLKQVVRRERPPADAHAVPTFTSSFPSGHSLMAMVMLVLAAQLMTMGAPWALRALMLALAAGLTIAIGVARIYLRVHWPSDVLAAWFGGGAWVLGALLVYRHFG
jgi:undecaprenyl-diphosphatase